MHNRDWVRECEEGLAAVRRDRDLYPEDWTGMEREAWKSDYLAGRPVQLPHPEHGPGECTYCDALKALMAEAERER